MQKLEQQLQQMQDYSQQNPQVAPTPNQGNSVFDEPFFNKFFGRPDSQPKDATGNTSLDKD